MGREAKRRAAVMTAMRQAVADGTPRHEAAHAVAAHSLGIRVRSITLDPGAAAADIEETGTPLERAVIIVAGILTSARDMALAARAHGAKNVAWMADGNPSDDRTRWEYWCARAAGGDHERAVAVGEESKAVAMDILGRRLAAWDALTASLVERGRLEEADVLEILGPYPPRT